MISQILEIIKGPGKALIDKIPDVNERNRLAAEFDQALVQMGVAINDHITERHKTDMASDSWLSKNIRPLSLIFILTLYTLFSVSSGNIPGFEVEPRFVELLGQWGMLIMSFYFGGRTAEKIGAVFKK